MNTNEVVDDKTISNLSNEDLLKLAIEIKEKNNFMAPSKLERSTLLKELMEFSHYEYYMDKLSAVDTFVRFEVMNRFLNGTIK